MKAFARHRNSTPPPDQTATDAVEDEPTDPTTGDDFLQRLGDLDQFIGTGTTAPIGTTGATTTRLPGIGAPQPLRNGPGRGSGTLPTTPPANRRLFDARAAADDATASAATAPITDPHEDTSEAEDFLQRLSDLDRFIAPPTGAVPAVPVPAVPAPVEHHDDAAGDDFLQRLGDLDRFIGGGRAADAPPVN